jgi:hypothetical protein
MGIFAEGSVNIYFDKVEDADKVHEMLNIENPEESFIKVLGEEKGKGHYCFYEFCDNGHESVDFMLSSGRIQNAEWQVDQIILLLKTLIKSGEISGVGELSCSMMMEAEGRYMEGDEFLEEGGE